MWTINDCGEAGPSRRHYRTGGRPDRHTGTQMPVFNMHPRYKTPLARVNEIMKPSLTRSGSSLGLSVAAHVRNIIWEVVNFLAHVAPSARQHAEDGQRSR